VFGAVGVLVLLVLGGILTFLSPLLLLGGSSGISSGASAFFAIVVGLVIAALDLIGGYLMLQRRLTGWWILAIGIGLQLLSNLFSAAVLGLVFSLAVAYVHLEVKPRYT
jgi:hypothetical protein